MISARFVGAALVVAAAGCSKSPPHAQRPNVLVVSIDMLRPDHLGCYGYAKPTSRTIDRLAAEGALFENDVSSTSWTLPAHTALFTSLYDGVHGVISDERRLPASATTLAERFHAAGYETAGFFSGPYLHPDFGFAQGFDRYVDCTSYGAKLEGRAPIEWGKDVEARAHEDVTSDRVVERFGQWFGGQHARPFFAFVHLWDVHYDFLPPPPYDKRFDPDYSGWVTGRDFWFDPRIAKDMAPRDLQHLVALYDGEIAWTDAALGRIRALLEEAGVLDDTIVVVTSDHGTEFFEHGQKAHRRTLFDESIRTPLVVRFPRAVKSGLRIAHQTSIVDVGPTVLELAGLPPADAVLGASTVPLLRDPNAAFRETAVSELFTNDHVLRSVRTREWKFVDDLREKSFAVYDLVNDPAERTPIRDFTGAVGRTAREGYSRAIAEVGAFVKAHDVPSQHVESSAPSADVRRKLGSFGYGGADPRHDDPTPK